MSGSEAAGRRRWPTQVRKISATLAAIAIVVLLARWARSGPEVTSFISTYPGRTPLPSWAPMGIPAWLAWQHVLNAFFLLLIIRTGYQVRTQSRPEAYWTRNNTGMIRTRRQPKKISLMLWLHLSLDTLWVLNGVIFYVLIFSTGQWVRIVPTDWSILPNAASTALQYASLDWPTETGWTNYNALQVLSYFVIVFIAAPVSVLTGLRMSSVWPADARVNRIYKVETARAAHFPTMVAFALFVVVHVILVLATGPLNNLNHMYASRDDQSWIGFLLFVVSLVAIAIAWVCARPLFLRSIAGLSGKVTAR